MNIESAPPKVFISYSHDSQTHKENVLELTDRLRKDGVDATIDRYEEAPPEGWQRWMLDRVEESDFVLIICTEQYNRRFRGKEERGKGKGATWEGGVIIQELYDTQGQNSKFIPITIKPEDANFIPISLGSTSNYRLENDDGYELLYRRLTNQPETTKPDLGKLKTLPPRAPKQNFSNNSFNTKIGDFDKSSSIDPRYSIPRQAESDLIDLPCKADILREFKQVSAIGRNWVRTIDRKPIERQEKSQVIESINRGHKTVLIVDSPGSGKTCLLLDLLEYYEQSSSHNVLFIRGDEFNDANEQKQLPEYLVEKCEVLSKSANVVVIIDSLDVLSASRQHETLKFFMRLIDRLMAVENISVIVSCRTFDLKYDSHLKNRSWQHKVNLEPLDFDTVVSGFLRKWNIEPGRVNEKLRQLLGIPQNLKMYGQLAAKGVVSESTSIYQLHEEFIEELIRKSPQMGNSAIDALQSMADYLLEQRTWDLPRRKFNCSEEIFRELSSLGVILTKDNNQLSFSHQTLAECLMVTSNLNKGISFTSFITDRVQLPFIRPAVRAFLFYLRINDPAEFRKQVKNALSCDRIAYHIKRLICESISEIEPMDSDRGLIGHLYNHHSNLFGSFIERITSYEWLQFLKQYWLPIAKQSRDKEVLLRRFFWRLEVWRDRYPEEVIELWIDAFNSRWFDYKALTMVVSQQLDGLQNWSIARIEHLLKLIMQHLPEDGNYRFTNHLSRWIEVNNSGDDMLWQYMTSSISDEDKKSSFRISNKLRYTSSGLDDANFLENRLLRSNDLLDLAVASLERWSKNSIPPYLEKEEIWDMFLSDSSYGRASFGSIKSLTYLLDGIEKAFQYHCQSNDKWWQDNEPRLRITQDGCLRYFLIQAYQENIQSNLDGIIVQLNDKRLFESRYLGNELRKLITIAYPYLPTPFVIKHQAMIMSLHDNMTDLDNNTIKCINSVKYKLFKQISIIFRTIETQNFLDSQEDFHERGLPNLSTQSSWSVTLAPFAKEQLLDLSDTRAIDLLNFYVINNDTSHSGRGYVSSPSEVKWVLVEAASLDPIRFTSRILHSINPTLYTEHIPAVIEGIANHLCFRSGQFTSGNEWKPVEPLPNEINLAKELLKLLERYSLDWLDGDASSKALSACCKLLIDDECVERLSLLLFWIYQIHLNENKQVTSSEDELLIASMSSVSGVAIESAIRLYNRRLELNLEIPELLIYLIQHASKDKRLYVRVGILQHLAFTIHKQPEWGWKLFRDIFQEPQSLLWKHAERCLYHNYHDRFDLVSLYLDRIFQEGMDEAGDTWGRISALASLSGHITQELVFERLQLVANCESAWEGVAQVFTANLHISEHTDTCYSGILKVLEIKDDRLPSGILVKISKCFWGKMDIEGGTDRKNIDSKILNNLLEKILSVHELAQLHVFDISQYLSELSRVNPLEALQLLELSAIRLKEEADSAWILEPKYLIMTLKEIFAEVEEIQNMDLINRAIDLQDLFLELNINGIDNFLNKAARS